MEKNESNMDENDIINLEESNRGRSKFDKGDWADFLESAKDRRSKKDDTYESYKNKFRRYIKTVYENNSKNNSILTESWNYYQDAIDINFSRNYMKIKDKSIKYILPRCKIMLITANPIEKAVLHHKVVDNKTIIMVRSICSTTAFYVFKLGEYWVAHIHQSETGAEKDLGTSNAINEALKYFTPNVIISLGVAFGINYRIQHIGNVLVSRRLFPYSDNKRDEDDIKPDRTQDKTIDNWLHVRLENAIGFMDGVTYGDILSGGSVMSSCEEKDRVCLGYTKEDFIIGGEMEGNAVFQCTKRMGIPGVVIKGICDYGIVKNGIYVNEPDKEKKLKESLQAYAMMQAIQKCEPLFNDKTLFASPKNIDIVKVIGRYNICKILLALSLLLIATYGICGLSVELNRENNFITSLYDLLKFPYCWLAFLIGILLSLIIRYGDILICKSAWRLYIWIRGILRNFNRVKCIRTGTDLKMKDQNGTV